MLGKRNQRQQRKNRETRYQEETAGEELRSKTCDVKCKKNKSFGGGGDRGGTVVKVLRYKSEGRWLDSRRCHWNFSLT